MANIIPSIPGSQVLKFKSRFENKPLKKFRKGWQKELVEARKADTAPAAVDEEGKDINSHISQNIATEPWYYHTTGPTLNYQRPEEKQKDFSYVWYKHRVNTVKGTFCHYPKRNSACESSEAMTDKKENCIITPRKIDAIYSGANMADEYVHKKLNYAGKRDRWSRYDPSENKSMIEEFQKIKEAKGQLKAEKLSANEESGDDDKYVDGTEMESKQRITVRNLKDLMDTAKYLRNLDQNSTYYEPKMRSIHENPNPQNDDSYSREDFVCFTDDTTKQTTEQFSAWEAYERGVDVHLLAEPTKLELLQKENEEKKEQFKSKVQNDILEGYAGEEYLQALPKSLYLAQSDYYVEYLRSGKIIKGQETSSVEEQFKNDLQTEEESHKEAELLLRMNERKRSYNTMVDVMNSSEEEMEVYYSNRKRKEGSMNQFM